MRSFYEKTSLFFVCFLFTLFKDGFYRQPSFWYLIQSGLKYRFDVGLQLGSGIKRGSSPWVGFTQPNHLLKDCYPLPYWELTPSPNSASKVGGLQIHTTTLGEMIYFRLNFLNYKNNAGPRKHFQFISSFYLIRKQELENSRRKVPPLIITHRFFQVFRKVDLPYFQKLSILTIS